ncbi:MAG TPA: hypothetical protein PKE64_27070, partial [Anaerolineae bacterium]|nr:hypothetical protein [Anaerolineae bacterium]
AANSSAGWTTWAQGGAGAVEVAAAPPLALTTTIITVEEQVRGRLGPGPSGQIGGLISPFLGHFRLPT